MEAPHAGHSALAGYCANCGAAVSGNYCSQCGQSNLDLRVPFSRALGEYLSEIFSVDSHLVQSFARLLRPGQLTEEFLAGRRARYGSPVRLYLICSFLFLTTATLSENALHIGFAETDGAREPSRGPRFGITYQPSASARTLDAASDSALALQRAAKVPFEQRVEEAARRANADPDRLRQRWFQAWAWVMFLVVPLFALLLKLAYPRRFYLEHLIFGVHYHAFAFLVFTVLILLTNLPAVPPLLVVSGALLLSVPAYLVLALRRVYGGGLVKALAHTLALGFTYLLVIAACALAVTFATLLWF